MISGTSGRALMKVSRVLFLLLAMLLAAAPARAQDADTILLNGNIITLDAAGSVEALAIHDGKIVAAGRNADIIKRAGTSTRRIDLAGRTVIPGLIDSHMHAIRAALV